MDEGAILHELGKRIRTQRKSIGLTQEALALAANVDRSYYGAVERGERNVTFTVLCRISAALECDIARLTQALPPVV
ncbi:helix-turn-helix transcriptional regulator [Sphingobium sp.]|uniref:helix-turn-helix domain-containing protein n=1 Tax=Sphingobium sp. TaxID=1912891 RepID=UPI0028BF167D|nr:helix-turn-helix transcriptional regulator [Sphingobium sp.]